jgi:hypothetical protein
MADSERIRIEIALDNHSALSVYVTTETADEIDSALAGERAGTVVVDADDGRYTIVLSSVVYVKRFARESRVGFG